MKSITLALAILSFNLSAQVQLQFDKRFVECEDKWIAFEMNEDSTYNFGFIYIDEQAGLTYNSEGTFKFSGENSFKVVKFTETSIKVRLQPNNVKVAILPTDMFKALDIEEIPEWLSSYKSNENSPRRLHRWGYMYNSWGECARALSFLEQAYEIAPEFEGLAAELGYSYNCLGMYDSAIELLENDLSDNLDDSYYNKEYIFALVKGNQISKATEQYYNSLKNLSDNRFHAESCFNILQYYYNIKDKENFDKWYKELGKQPNSNEQITKYTKLMKKELK